MKPPRLLFESAASGTGLSGARPGAAGCVAALMMLLAFGALVHATWRLADAQSQAAAWQSRLAAAEAAMAPAAPPAGADDPPRIRAWNAVARQLNTPWSDLLDALESATPSDVALVSVAPDATQGAVRLQAEAKSLQALLGYEQALRTTPLFREVLLARHETNETDAQRPLRLHLVLRMRPAQGASP